MKPRPCEEFLQRLDALLGDTLTEGERRSLEAHAAQCERCNDLLAALRHPEALDREEDDGSFLASLMERTSGSACKRAEGLLPAWIDADLDETDMELVQLHLQHCGTCEALASVLLALRQDLPALAFAEPGNRFTAEVMAASRALRRPSTSFEEKVVGLWQHLVMRPRFAWEFATAASFVLVLLCGLPFSPLRPLPRHALAAVQMDPFPIMRSLGSQVGPTLDGMAQSTWEHTGEPLRRAAEARAQSFAQEHEEAMAAWKEVRTDLAEVGDGIGRRNFARMSHGLQLLKEDLNRMFFRSAQTETEESS